MIFCSQKHNVCFYFQLNTLSWTQFASSPSGCLRHQELIMFKPEPLILPTPICSLWSLHHPSQCQLHSFQAKILKQWSSHLYMHQNHVEGLLKIPDCWSPTAHSFWFSRSWGWGTLFLFNRFLNDADIAGLVITLWELLSSNEASYIQIHQERLALYTKLCRVWLQSSPSHHHVLPALLQ